MVRTLLLALFPGALGDLLCCWPALAGLRAEGAGLTLAARDAWLAVLPEDELTPLSIERPEVADLFRSGPLGDCTRSLFGRFARIESWTGHGDRHFTRRLREASGGAAVAVHPFRALRRGEHAASYYARCAGIGAVPRRVPIRAAAAEWSAALWERHGLERETLVIHAGSGGAPKNWTGMAQVAAGWRARAGPVIAVGGPAEGHIERAIPHDVAVWNEPLDRVAAVLARGARYLGNDSGISHLAGSVGARGVALFASTDPVAWRPLGDGIRVLHAPAPCRRCGPNRFCTHRLRVDEVLAALRDLRDAAPPPPGAVGG